MQKIKDVAFLFYYFFLMLCALAVMTPLLLTSGILYLVFARVTAVARMLVLAFYSVAAPADLELMTKILSENKGARDE